MNDSNDSGARLDKWLWAVRIFKSRTLAAAACRAGSVLVNGHPSKPSRDLHPGEQLVVRIGLIHRSLVFLSAPKGRVAARQVPEFCEDRTPASEYEKVKANRIQQFLAREKGSGRPTKRERRDIDRFLES
jgi:ribosome-associated heat shock protein Hsp15